MEALSTGLTKGAWTAQEDTLLRQCIDKNGEGKWHQVPSRAGLNRCRKSCRLRWLNYLKPSIKKGKFGSDEVDLIIRLHKLLGNRWSLIAGRIPGRTANDIKNFWNTHLSKKEALSSMTTSKIGERNPTSSAATSAPNIDVLKPQFCEDTTITCNKGKEKCEVDGDIMWWENFMEESGEADAVGSVTMESDEAGTSSMNSSSSMFDVEKLWSMFNGGTGELD